MHFNHTNSNVITNYNATSSASLRSLNALQIPEIIDAYTDITKIEGITIYICMYMY